MSNKMDSTKWDMFFFINEKISSIKIEIIFNGELKTAQIKPFTHFKTENGEIMVMGSANVKPYKTNWLIFAKNNKDILVFDNKHSKIVDGNFVFPEENLIYTLS